MASSSSSGSNSQCRPRKYDVFLSFRGEDTRNTFTSHLYEGLKNRGIHTFKDDIELKYGDPILEELSTAIEESQVALVVFSNEYAASKWCLEELVRIMECNKKEKGQRVMPVFYNVDPSHVRNQSGSFADAFAKHELRYKDDIEGMQKVKGWRAALREAANLSGCDTHNRSESDCIRHLVDQISKLCKTSLSCLEGIVGINTHLEEVKSLLQMEINDVRIVGIWGMGGVGKTTRAIFDSLSWQFKAASFLADIKENKYGMHSLQNILLSELLGTKDDNVNNKYDGKRKIQSRFRSMKVLIVLDDINERDHLEYLADDADWFGYGSRVVVTTRNRDLIMNANAIHEVTPLPDLEAMQLFNQYAFRKEDPDELFKKLSLEVVNRAKGLPLALKLWGSSLHKKDLTRWEITVDQIKKIPDSDVIQKLKISYDGLKSEEQEIFLDMACLFRGKEKKEVMQILESCAFNAKYGLDILIDKALVLIDPYYDRIQMHDLIQEMGKYIVNMQKDPGERSRLWDAKDIKKVMRNNTGKKATEAIWVGRIQKLCLREKAMKKMKRLRIFGNYGDSIGIEYLPNNLRCFVNYNYPRESLPENFGPKRLVYLDLSYSLLRHLWTGIKHFPFLRKLDLSYSESLIRAPDFREMPNLEHLNLSHCKSLEEFDDSLGYCGKLIRCVLSYCTSLKMFPCVNVESLEYPDLRGCRSLEKFPEIKGRSKLGLEIKIDGSGIREVPSSFFQYQIHLTKLDLSFMKHLVSLPSNIGMLKSLVELNVSDCSKLESLPEEIGDLENLEKLYARCTLISRPPSSIARLNKLKSLSFRKRKSEVGLRCFVFPSVNDGLRSLEDLDLGYCNLIDGGLPEDIGSLSSLKELCLSGNNFEHLPRSIAHLGALQSLDLSNCKSLESLPEEIGDLENLERLDASFTLISRPPSSIARLNKLKFLSFEKSILEVRLIDRVFFVFPQVNGGLRSLERLDLSYCNLIDGGLPEDIGSLSSLEVLDLTGNNFEHFPRSIAQLGALQSLDLFDCKRLKELPGFMGMPNLKYLNLLSCDDLEEVDDSLGYCGKLISLHLGYCKSLKRFPCVNVESLEFLNLRGCSSLEKFPEIRGRMKPKLKIEMEDSGIRELPSSYFQFETHLTKLDLSFMKHLVALPSSIGMLKSLVELDVSDCSSLEILPEEIGHLENLERLDAHSTLISRPPSSIVRLNKLELLNFEKQKSQVGLVDRVNLVFPQVNEGLHSLERLYLSYCNLKDGGLPEDIGSLSSLKELYLNGNNFENLPRSIAQLGALRILDVSNCARLTQLPGFPQQLDTIYADWSNDWICNSLFQNISSLQHDISASASLSLRVFTGGKNIPSWFHHQGIGRSVSVNLPENWYIGDNFLGFAVCYSGRLTDTTVHLIPLCNRMSWTTRKVALSNHSKFDTEYTHLFLVPFASLWDTSKANGKTPNDYAFIGLTFSGEIIKYGFRLLYKDETELEALLQMRENNDEPTEDRIMTRRSRYDDSEASSSSRKKQRSHSNIHGSCL